MFDHFLITRFNLRNPEWDVTKNNESLLTDDWMEDRMKLFENFCLPSIQNQTNLNFTWLLYLDITTKDFFKNRIAELIKGRSNIQVFYIDGMPLFYKSIQNYISANSNSKPFLITSRIDNDDCVRKDFINEIQKKFNSQNYQAIDIIKGYSLQIEPTYMLGKKEHLYNPFISLIEKNINPKTVWLNNHTQWKKEKNITQIKDKRLWMSIIHEKNKVNEFDGYDNVSWHSIKNDFIVSEVINTEINQNLLPYKNWRFLSFRNRLYVKFGLYLKTFKKTIGLYNK